MADFWRIIGSGPMADRSDVEAALTGVRSRLRDLDGPAAIPVVLSDRQVFEQTDDHFLYARCACLLAGPRAVRAVLDDGSTFARFVAPRLQSAEALLYAARTEYRARTGGRGTS